MGNDVQKVPYMPSDRFRQWVRKYGIRKLARDLIKTYGRSVSPTTVHFWVNAKTPRRPRYDTGIAELRGQLAHPLFFRSELIEVVAAGGNRLRRNRTPFDFFKARIPRRVQRRIGRNRRTGYTEQPAGRSESGTDGQRGVLKEASPCAIDSLRCDGMFRQGPGLGDADQHEKNMIAQAIWQRDNSTLTGSSPSARLRSGALRPLQRRGQCQHRSLP